MGKSKERNTNARSSNTNVDVESLEAKKEDDHIKSNAVVKFSAAVVPAPFTLLQNNTNLNVPPPNWLSSSVSMYGVPSHILNPSGFSSFTMANQFPDCMGDVDVVSDAENIKKLLKMAYSTSPISLLIHRVENTLLIDDFDLKKFMMNSEGRWGWLRKFLEHLIQSMHLKPEKVIEYSDKSRTALQSKSLMSKFFYHSLASEAATEPRESPNEANPNVAIPLPCVSSEQALPEPKLEEELPDAGSSHTFSRNVVWTFEDIQMLLGTDIPIFGGGTHPCVSLKLRDMNKPINVLTGMDYWLDNLMCNVPEVVMCYHLNGIVQRYELIKTEDLPNLPNSKFSPKVIRDIAQNILSFLKSNTTKAGHTYWLFKDRDDEVVKLYDLTSLCGHVLEEGQTPFTIPVAMLLYRVARNMKNQDGRRQSPAISTLLKNCIALLPEDKYPEIVTSAHYMLADVYLPSDVDPRNPQLDDSTDSDSEVIEEPDEYLGVSSTSLTAIRDPEYDRPASNPIPDPLTSDVPTRCEDALKHVLNGLRILSEINSAEPEIVNPSEAIPMPCVSPERKPNATAIVESPNAVTKKEPPSESDRLWAKHLRALLFEKAALVFIALLEQAFNNNELGKALRLSSMAMRLLIALRRFERSLSRWEGTLYGKAGDALLFVSRMGKDMAVQDAAYRDRSAVESDLVKLLRLEGEPTDVPSPMPPTLDSMETLMLASAACYHHALSIETEKDLQSSFYRRLGNVENDLGVFLMNQACAGLHNQSESNESKVADLLTASQAHLDAGISAFENVADAANLALLYSNTGKLMRLRAHFYLPSQTDRAEMVSQEKFYYSKAIDNYLKAIKVLGERSSNPPVWESIFWELSTTYSMMAKLLQDFPAADKSQEDAERELTDVLHKALKYTDLDAASSKLTVYQFRAANIHHRLAMLHHRQFRNSADKIRKKHILQLTKLHYEKSVKLMMMLENRVDLLRVQMERIGLAETLAEEATGFCKAKILTNALEMMVELVPTLCAIAGERKEANVCSEDYSPTEEKEQIGLLKLMLHRMQQIILQMVKISSNKKSGNENKGSKAADFKSLYGVALRCCPGDSPSAAELARGVSSVLKQLSPLLQSCSQTR